MRRSGLRLQVLRVEPHGAWLCACTISPVLNQRRDKFVILCKATAILEIIEGIRKKCNNELWWVSDCLQKGLDGTSEIVSLPELMMKEELIEFLDMSLRDVFKKREDELYKSAAYLLLNLIEKRTVGVRENNEFSRH